MFVENRLDQLQLLVARRGMGKRARCAQTLEDAEEAAADRQRQAFEIRNKAAYTFVTSVLKLFPAAGPI